MAYAVILLALEFILFCCGVVILFKKDKPFAFYFGALYLYSTPALIGYCFFPSLSIKLSAYWGMSYWLEFFFFIVLSMVSFFLFSLFYINKLSNHKTERRKLIAFVNNGRLSTIVLLAIVACCGVQIYNLKVNAEYIGYMKSSNANLLTAIASLLFQISVGTIIILYYTIRKQSKLTLHQLQLLIVFFLCITTFIVYGVKSGNRHILLQVVLGILFIEIELKKLNKKTLLIYVGILVLVLLAFQTLRISRNAKAVQTSFSMESLLSNDYYPPAHILFAAMRYNYVKPMEVIKSNIANSFVGLGVDYLQASIMKLIVKFRISRTATYAFYVFSEGYMFMGKWGFLYNGFVLSSLVYLWRRIAKVKDKEYAVILSAILVCYSIDFVRGQTSYFIRYLWLYLLPNVIIYALLNGVKKENECGIIKEGS